MEDRHPQRRRPAGAGRAGNGGAELSGRKLGSPTRRRRLHSDAVPDQGPVRTCVGCRARSAADDLLRVVVVNGALTPDPRRRLPGRGAWLHPVPECLHRAEKRSAFPRALRVPGPLDARLVRTRIERAGIVTEVDRQASRNGARDHPGSVIEESKVDPS